MSGGAAFGRETGGTGTLGILLAGGLSRRFGSPKAFARLDGPDSRMFYERALNALEGVCDSCVVAASRELADRFPSGLEVCEDLPAIAGQGPLAGICTAMRRRPAARYIVMACDMPLIGQDELRRLYALAESCSEADVVAVRTPQSAVPLLSVWRQNLADSLEQAIREERLSVMKLLAGLETVWIDSRHLNDDEQVFRNYNTPNACDLR